MKGHEDTNKDNKITARYLHSDVEQNVLQQSFGLLTPEQESDKE